MPGKARCTQSCVWEGTADTSLHPGKENQGKTPRKERSRKYAEEGPIKTLLRRGKSNRCKLRRKERPSWIGFSGKDDQCMRSRKERPKHKGSGIYHTRHGRLVFCDREGSDSGLGLREKASVVRCRRNIRTTTDRGLSPVIQCRELYSTKWRLSRSRSAPPQPAWLPQGRSCQSQE